VRGREKCGSGGRFGCAGKEKRVDRVLRVGRGRRERPSRARRGSIDTVTRWRLQDERTMAHDERAARQRAGEREVEMVAARLRRYGVSLRSKDVAKTILLAARIHPRRVLIGKLCQSCPQR